jgi:site-specific DNA-methyltransferase (adenine-specific)
VHDIIARLSKRPKPTPLAVAYAPNVAQGGDASELLRSLPDACTPLVMFDPQFRQALDKQQYGNEGVGRQRERAALPAMTDEYIDSCCREAARVLMPSGYLMRWVDAFQLVQGHHLRVVADEADDVLQCVDLIAWDNLRMGMGYRSRRRGDYLVVLQKPPVKAKATWRDHGIPDRWAEKVDRKIRPHIKPIGLITRLIGAVTSPGDLVIDPAAGAFGTMHAAHRLGREFIGCDKAYHDKDCAAPPAQTPPAKPTTSAAPKRVSVADLREAARLRKTGRDQPNQGEAT